MRRALDRPAFYALTPGRGRDLVTLLHLPYTLWCLSYVAIGAALAPHLHLTRLLATLGAFALAVGLGAHALDELNGRPLSLGLSDRALKWIAAVSITAAGAIGVVGAFVVSASLVAFVAAGVFLVLAYDLGWFGGRFHTDAWFALAWGGFPVATGYWCSALTVRPAGVIAVGAAVAISAAQRRLSTPVRELRRRTASVSGRQVLNDGRVIELDRAHLAAPLDDALAALSLGMILLAAAMVAARL